MHLTIILIYSLAFPKTRLSPYGFQLPSVWTVLYNQFDNFKLLLLIILSKYNRRPGGKRTSRYTHEGGYADLYFTGLHFYLHTRLLRTDGEWSGAKL